MSHPLASFAAQLPPQETESGVLGLTILTLFFAVSLANVIALWVVFERADEPGWAALVPLLNLVTFAKVARKPAWYGFLLLLPIVGVPVVWIVLCVGVARRFSRGMGFGIGLALLPFVFFPLLALSGDVPRASIARA